MFRVQEGWRVKTGRIGGTYMSGSDKGKEEGGVHGGAGLFLFFANALAMIGVSLPYSRVSPSRPRSHTPRFRGRLDHKALPCLAPKASAGMDAAWPRVG